MNRQNVLTKINKLGFMIKDYKLFVDGTDLPFDYNMHKDKYDQLADLMQIYVQQEIVTKYNCKELWVPFDKQDQSNIFVSDDFETNEDKAMIIIQGTGAVRAGLFARQCCVNDDLYLGSTFRLQDYCNANNIAYIILNPNCNRDPRSGNKIGSNRTMESHCNYVFDNYIKQKCKAKNYYILAHSAGGHCAYSMYSKNKLWFLKNVRGLVLTDSWFGDDNLDDPNIKDFFENRIVHFIASDQPLGTFLGNNCWSVFSAGDERHAYTTGKAWNSIFEWYNSKLNN